MKRSKLRILLLSAGMMLCSAAASFGQLSTGLLNYWNFEGDFKDTAGTTTGSASTSIDNGTPQIGATIATDATTNRPAGSYLNCNRAAGSSWVGVPNSSDVLMAGRSLTISAWFRVSSFSQNWQALVAHGEGSDYRIARRGSANRMAYAGGTGDTPDTGPLVSDNNWHHVVAITETGVSTRIWIDGAMVATTVNAGTNITNNGAAQMMIGGNPQGDAGAAVPSQYRSWGGDIDDVAMWSRVLTPAEIGNIYTQGRLGVPLSTIFIPPDTDSDGLPDFWENLYGLSPTDPTGDNGAAGDPDADGLTNAQELARSTKPNDNDTDDDALTDGAEVNTHNSNPILADTDSDGLSDGQEVNTYHTNPVLADTDTDGISDGGEVSKGSNPAVADSGFGFGLYAYWPMDSNFSSTTGGFTATAMGTSPVARVAGKFGSAVQLDGIDQYLVADGDENQFDFTGQSFTVSAWFTADTIDKDWQCLIGKGDAGNSWRMHRRGGDQPPELSFCGGNADLPKHSIPLNVGTGFYHHVVGVSKAGVDVKLYMDGVLISTGPAPALGNSANAMRIGANPDTSPGRFWTGKVDDLAFWCRPLSETEIQQMWNGGTGRSVDDLIDPTVLEFTNVFRNSLTDEWTLTWASKANRTYRLNFSTDMLDFTGEVTDSVPSTGASTSFGPFPNPNPGSNRLFFKATQN